MAVIGDYGNRLTIVARQHALNRAAPVRLEGNPLANPELEHVRVGADVLQQTKALDDPMVEDDQFGFRQPVNVDHHEASPSALNGVNTSISQEKLPLYLGFFEFVHNARHRGKALLSALVAALVM